MRFTGQRDPLPGRRRRGAVVYRLVVLGLLGLMGYYLYRLAPALIASPTAVEVKAEEREVTLTAWANGVVEAHTQARIAAEVTGEIVELGLDEGMVVREGQVVARLDPDTIRAQMEQVRASIAVAEANLKRTRSGSRRQEIDEGQAAANKAKVVMEEKKSDLDRYQKLYENKAASLKELESVRTAYMASKDDFDKAQAQVALLTEGPRDDDVEVATRRLDEAKAQLKSLEVALTKTTIKAPITGTVVRKLADKGEVVTPGQPLAQVVDMESLEAVLNVEETYIASIQVGQSVELSVDALPAEPVTGKVSYIAPISSEQLKISLLKEEEDVKRFHVKVTIDAKGGRIRSGMSIKGKLSIVRKGVFVPREAVILRGGVPVVRVMRGASPVEQPVRTGVTQDRWVQILDGLIGGERVVLHAVLARD